MTVRELIAVLETLPEDFDVVVFEAFDSNGPNTWETPVVTIEGTEVRISPEY
jgi:hypothetical protein